MNVCCLLVTEPEVARAEKYIVLYASNKKVDSLYDLISECT